MKKKPDIDCEIVDAERLIVYPKIPPKGYQHSKEYRGAKTDLSALGMFNEFCRTKSDREMRLEFMPRNLTHYFD
jgi:hypothetical protein